MNKPIKLIIIGDVGVGKSCILLRIVENRFRHIHDLTIGVEFGSLFYKYKEKNYKIHIWDTAGQESFKSVVRTYYRGSDGIILVYDITRNDTLENMKYWLVKTVSTILSYTTSTSHKPLNFLVNIKIYM